jgi:uncharacterized membrane protein YeaQ/YmgE (transglycosylase-associated protein family)
MLLIISIIIGVVIGIFSALFFKRREQIVANMLYGIVGAMLFCSSYYVYNLLHGRITGITAAGITLAVLGAWSATFIANLLPPLRNRRSDDHKDNDQKIEPR